MSEGPSIAPFFTFLAILLYFILSGRKGKKRQEPKRVIPPRPLFLKPEEEEAPLPQKPLEKEELSSEIVKPTYKVTKRKEVQVLPKRWQEKDSLKKAFVLSEILKRVDERDPF